MASDFMQSDREEELERIRRLEASSDYQEKLKQLREKMNSNLQWKMYTIICVVIGVFLFMLFRYQGLIAAAVIAFFVLYPRYKKRQELFGGAKEDNEHLYVENMLNPIVKEIFPEGEISVNSDFLLDAIRSVIPSSRTYKSYRQISFHNESDLAVANVYAYHTEERTSSDGKHQTTETVQDFRGQVYQMRFPGAFDGHIRVVPTRTSAFLKREVQDYPGTRAGEMKIDTEDIRHNENYNIYCTDELAARNFLNPTVLDWFDKNISQSQTAIYIENHELYISRYTDRDIFPLPRTLEEIDHLSLMEEYKKLRGEIDFIQSFTAIFQ